MFTTSDKVVTLEALRARIAGWRITGDQIVFTNGCFDLLHAGHVGYLESARQLGDRLIVGLNSDKSVSRLKGPQRPIQLQGDRARILAALECVDAVVLFEEDTPLKLIQAVLPDVLAKGGDYAVKDIVGHEVVQGNGGDVRSLQFVEGVSTTDLVEKIQNWG